MQVNLYDETVKVLVDHGYTEDDVLFISDRYRYMFINMHRLRELCDGRTYNNIVYNVDYPSIASDLIVQLKDGNFLERDFRDEGEVSVEYWRFREFKNLEEIPDVFCRMVDPTDPLHPDFDFKSRLDPEAFDNSLEDQNFEEEESDTDDDSSPAAQPTPKKAPPVFLNTVESISSHAKQMNMIYGGKKRVGPKRMKKSSSLVV